MEGGSSLGIDSAQITSMLAEVGTLVGAVGLAALSVYIGIKAWGYIKRST